MEWGLIIWIILYLKLSYKTLPKALRTQASTALTSNIGLVFWFGRFGVVGRFGSVGLVR